MHALGVFVVYDLTLHIVNIHILTLWFITVITNFMSVAYNTSYTGPELYTTDTVV